jgi:fatty acyl-CoA reductase
MVYVSTAFSNCPRTQIDEIIYDPPITGAKLMSLLEALDDEKLDKVTPM